MLPNLSRHLHMFYFHTLASQSRNSQNISHFGHFLMSGLPTLFPHMIFMYFSATECGNYTTTPKTSPHLAISTISTILTSILLHHYSTFNYPLYISSSLVYICIVDHNRSLFLLICVTLPPTGPFWCMIGYKT
jgi:hypothetical protein